MILNSILNLIFKFDFKFGLKLDVKILLKINKKLLAVVGHYTAAYMFSSAKKYMSALLECKAQIKRGLNQKLKSVVRKMFEVGDVLSKLVHLKRITDEGLVGNFSAKKNLAL